MQRLEYVVGTGLHGYVMQTTGFAPQTGLYSLVHATLPPTFTCVFAMTSE
jgi:hypothetical protein